MCQRKAHHLNLRKCLSYNNFLSHAGMAELADAVDSKSTAPQRRASSSLAPGITKSHIYGFLTEAVGVESTAIVPGLSRSFAKGAEMRRAASLRSCSLTIL